MYRLLLESPVGTLTLWSRDAAAVSAIRFGREDGPAEDCPVLRRCEEQLEAYFRGELRAFDLPLDPGGTAFQRLVWAQLCRIPYGATRTYGQIAAAIGRPKAARAVGMANHVNPLPIVVPCHRVVGSGGKLVGYAGGLAVKEFLLGLEGRNCD